LFAGGFRRKNAYVVLQDQQVLPDRNGIRGVVVAAVEGVAGGDDPVLFLRVQGDRHVVAVHIQARRAKNGQAKHYVRQARNYRGIQNTIYGSRNGGDQQRPGQQDVVRR